MENVRYAVRAFAFKDDKVVCIKYKNHDKDYYDIPGGKIEYGENEIQACVREFKEETGIDVNDLKCIGTVSIVYPDKNKKFVMKTYFTNKVDGNPQEFDENDSYWIPISELIKKEKRFAITHLLDEDLIKYFNSDNLDVTFTCDNDHNVIDIQFNK